MTPDRGHRVTMQVNRERVSLVVEARRTLADALREELGLTGTHLGCEHGVCGACTVILDGEPVRSCLVLAVQAAGCHIETVESLSEHGDLGPIQQAMVESHAFQCAFCASGFLMSIRCLLETNPRPSEQEIREELAGNLCRCTGYQAIVDGVFGAIAKLGEQVHA